MSAVVLKPSPLIVFLASVLVSCAARVEYQSPSLPPPPPQPLVAEPLPEPYAPPPPPPPSPPDEGGTPSGSSRPDAPTRRASGSTRSVPDGAGYRPGRRRWRWKACRTSTSTRWISVGPGTSRRGAGARTITAFGSGIGGIRAGGTATGWRIPERSIGSVVSQVGDDAADRCSAVTAAFFRVRRAFTRGADILFRER